MITEVLNIVAKYDILQSGLLICVICILSKWDKRIAVHQAETNSRLEKQDVVIGHNSECIKDHENRIRGLNGRVTFIESIQKEKEHE